MKEIINKDNINIEEMIYEIRGIEVMLDSDLAMLYKCKNGTKEINQAVKNNIEKFPKRYSWILTDKELLYLRSKFLTTNISSMSRSNPRVFTEQGVAMLATILKSKTAVEVSIRIMDTFVKMRHYINFNSSFLPHKFMLLEKMVDNNAKRIDELFDKFNSNDIAKNTIFFEGEIYDAYSLLIDIFNTSISEIIIIDNYAGKELLDILKEINRNIILVSKNINEILKKKYISEYDNITFINNNSFHDRFIIIDRKKLYTCGASFKDLGKKCFCISIIDDIEYMSKLLKNINQ